MVNFFDVNKAQNKSFTVNFFDVNKKLVYIHSIVDGDGQKCMLLTHVKLYQELNTHTNKITQVFGIRNVLCLYLTEGGCLQGEDMDITHR